LKAVKSLLKHLSLNRIFLRPIWVTVLVLFSVQIVSASLSLTQCHEQALHEHSSAEKTAMHDCGSHESSDKDEHCNDFGFCLFGHCHVNHCMVVLQHSGVNSFALNPESLLGLGTENKLVSLLDLDKPWQPPRA
jgi:hypothetical protein